jgi:hypothetical protein
MDFSLCSRNSRSRRAEDVLKLLTSLSKFFNVCFGNIARPIWITVRHRNADDSAFLILIDYGSCCQGLAGVDIELTMIDVPQIEAIDDVVLGGLAVQNADKGSEPASLYSSSLPPGWQQGQPQIAR